MLQRLSRYKVLSQLGDGSYGSVWKAINRQSGEVVAVKRMKRKFFSWEECMSLREVRSLRKLNHPCIVKLREVIRENNELFFIFEFLDYNLYQAMKQRQGRPFPEIQVKSWAFQIFQGLDHMHRNGYFHRDMKPENLLVRGADTIKIADFGLARETTSQPPYTEYVSTRWYRAPEVLLRKADYSAPVDMFAVGAIMAELYTLRPLFPGATEIDEICKISAVMGSFTAETWPEGERLSQQMGFHLDPVPQQPLSKFVPHASAAALDLMASLCQWDPSRRPTAAQALQHPFFSNWCCPIFVDAAQIFPFLQDLIQSPVPTTPPVLRERTNTAAELQAAGAVAASLANSEAAEPRTVRPPAQLPAAMPEFPTVGGITQKVDWTPMHTSMHLTVPRGRRHFPRDYAHRDLTNASKMRADREARHAPKAQAGQPPDLWVNAKSVVQPRQQAGFAQMQRGAPVHRGAWASPHFLPAAKAASGGHPGGRMPRPGPGPSAARGLRVGKASQDGSQVAPGLEAKHSQPVGGATRLGASVGPDVRLGDFGPLSASVRRSAAIAGNPRNGL